MWNAPVHQQCQGQHVSIRPLQPDVDTAGLFAAGHLTPQHLSIWQYLPYGPFLSHAHLHDWLVTCSQSRDPLFHMVYDRVHQRPAGMVSIMSIVPEHGRAELGHIWYDIRAQRTHINTETIFLLLSYLFDELQYRRVEWKCDNRNRASRAAAMRLGFAYEGTFRKHMIVKHHNRDTAWFAMTDTDWPMRKQRFTHYLTGQISHLG